MRRNMQKNSPPSRSLQRFLYVIRTTLMKTLGRFAPSLAAWIAVLLLAVYACKILSSYHLRLGADETNDLQLIGFLQCNSNCWMYTRVTGYSLR